MWAGPIKDPEARDLDGGQRQRGSNTNSAQEGPTKDLPVEDRAAPVTQRPHCGAMTQQPSAKLGRPSVLEQPPKQGSHASPAGWESAWRNAPSHRLCSLLPTHEAGIPGQPVIDLSKCQSKQAGTGAQLPGRGVRSCLHRVSRTEEGGQPRGRKWSGCQEASTLASGAGERRARKRNDRRAGQWMVGPEHSPERRGHQCCSLLPIAFRGLTGTGPPPSLASSSPSYPAISPSFLPSPPHAL